MSIKKIKYQVERNVKFQKKVKISFSTTFEGNNAIGTNSTVSNSSIGFGTYIGGNSYIVNAKIGKYCSIAANVRTVSGLHPTKKIVSMHPAFFSTAGQAGFSYVKTNIFEEHKYIDKDKKISVLIGNDVWIGENVLILEGVHIGNGAVIGAGSIVTKDIESYSINVGVPAKKIDSRFTEEQINFLDKVKWWDKGEEWIKQNIREFEDIERFTKIGRS